MNYLKGHWQLLMILALVFAAWQMPVVLPLKILVVFLHELAHATAAWLSGGEVVEMAISARQGGHAITRGGNGFLILSAGYLGSLLFGAGLLVSALHTDADRAILAGFGVVMLAVTALFMRDLFAIAFCGLTGAAMIAMARYLSLEICDMVLRVIGLTSLIYVPYDIFDDTIARSGQRSDARMLAEEYFGTTLFWGGLWLILSLAVIVWCLRHGIGRDSNIHFGRGGGPA